MGGKSSFFKLWVVWAALLAIPAAAWACTGQPTVLGVNPIAAAPGEQIRLGGEAVATSPLQIHWNSATGPIVGEVTPDSQGDFSLLITVPEASPGIYTLVLVSKADGSAGRTALEVLPSAPERRSSRPPIHTISTDLWSGFAFSDGAVGEASAASDARAPGGGGLLAGTALLAAGLISLFVLGAVTRSRRSSRKAS